MNRLPALFVSHGAPLFAVDAGTTGPALRHWAAAHARPRAIVVMSPHWMARQAAVMTTPAIVISSPCRHEPPYCDRWSNPNGMAASTIERVQRNMETTRTEAVDRFVSRLRDQLAPMLVEAQASLKKLEASETAFKKESKTIYAGLENQLEFRANASLAKTQEELDKNSAAMAAKANETLRNLYQNFEKAARANVESLFASVSSQMTRNLQEKATEVAREFALGLESYTRSYLESIGKTIAEIPQNMPGRSHQ